MKYDPSILFYIKKGKLDKKGEMPIYLRITVNGERAEITTNRKIEMQKWDSSLQRMKGRSEEEYHCEDIELAKLDVFFIRKFEIFLKLTYSNSYNTIMKYLLAEKGRKSFSPTLLFLANNQRL